MSDDDLRQRFQALRDADASGAPGFRETLAGPDVPARRAPVWRWAPALAAAAVLAVVVLRSGEAPEPAAPLFQPGQWAMPTDVLLELPGSELLREVPSLGTSPLASPPLPVAPPQSRWSGPLRRTLG